MHRRLRVSAVWTLGLSSGWRTKGSWFGWRAGDTRRSLSATSSSTTASGRQGGSRKTASVDVVKAKARVRDSQRHLTDFKIAQLEGKLISLPEVPAAWAELALNVKQLFRAILTRRPAPWRKSF